MDTTTNLSLKKPGTTDYYDIADFNLNADKIDTFAGQTNTALATLTAAVGSPLVANTASAMTDSTKIYVYTGSETGYTAGNWYYHNGSAWVSGGVYNSAAVKTDKTLLVSDVPADAKKTGDEITDLKSAFNNNLQYNSYNLALLTNKTGTDVSGGLTYQWINGGKCNISGTLTDASASSMINSPTEVPAWIELNKEYKITTNLPNHVGLRITEYYSGNTQEDYTFVNNTLFKFSTNIIGVRIQLYALSGYTINGTATIIISNARSNEEITNVIKKISKYTNSINNQLYWTLGKNLGSSNNLQSNVYAALAKPIEVVEHTIIVNKSAGSDSNGNLFTIYLNKYKADGTFIERSFIYPGEEYVVETNVAYIIFAFARASSSGVSMTDADIATYFNIEIINSVDSYNNIQTIKDSGEYLLNLLDTFCTTSDTTHNGVTYSWSDYYGCTVSGTSTDASFCNLYNGLVTAKLKFGKKYRVDFIQNIIAGNLHIRFLWYDKNGTLIQTDTNSKSFNLVVPNNAFKLIIRLYVSENTTVNTTIDYIKLLEYHHKKMNKRHIISFIDDDASADRFVTRYYDSCKRNGINGTYAVITAYWDRGQTDPDLLLGYEDDGMAMIMHCHEQSGSLAPEWENKNYNLCRKNLFTCIRKMTEHGFVNFRYWVTPSGVIDAGFKKIAVDADSKCLISSANWDMNSMGDSDRLYIRRCSFNPYTDGDADNTRKGSMANVKKWIDDLMDEESAWLIITTHYNTWEDYQTWDDTVDATGYPVGYSRMNELMQYAISSGADILTIPEAFAEYEPILSANLATYERVK